MKLYRSFYYILLFFILFSNISFASTELFVWSNSSEPLPTNTTPTESSLEFQSESAILIEQTTGQILYEYNSHKQLRPASVTKIMSILLIYDALESGEITLEDTINCSENAASMGGSQIWLDTTESLSVDEMLKAICIVSANDCVVAMAEHIAGSEELFVNMMNSKAKELGMNDTCFKNCHGIDEEGHVTSSYDIALMSKELLNKYPSVTNYSTIWMDSLRDGQSELVNTNRLVRNYSGCTGLKTGSTSLALYNLSASATRNDLNLIAVIMRAPTSAIRFSEAQKLLDYGFNNFSFRPLTTANKVIDSISISKSVENNLDISFGSTTGALVKKGTENLITQNIQLNNNISAPIYAGQQLGVASYYLNDELICDSPIIASRTIHKKNLFNMYQFLFKNWFNLFR